MSPRTSADRSGHAAVLATLFLLAPSAYPSEVSSRYAIQAQMRPLALSVDGRFGLAATARYAPETTSVDGRFVLKAVKVPEGGCKPLPDALFANGFEGP